MLVAPKTLKSFLTNSIWITATVCASTLELRSETDENDKKQTQKIENKIKTNNIVKNCFQLIISREKRDDNDFVGVTRKKTVVL